MYTVSFINVGRNKTSWTATTPVLSLANLTREIRKKHAIMSSEIDIHLNPEKTKGQVLLGDGRLVGTFTVQP